MFYGLPVVQLVFLWQNTVNVSGDTDLCYFNFRCARPFFAIYAFNNVFRCAACAAKCDFSAALSLYYSSATLATSLLVFSSL